MIERQFVNQKVKEFQIKEFISAELGKSGYSHLEIQRTPLGEKVIIYTVRPGLVVGKKGENINRLTAILKNRFKMENPQIEMGELDNPNLDSDLVADKIASTLERFGAKRFKSIGYRGLQEILDAGALGAEIVLSGKIPSSRAKSWRFKAGYLKKSGDISMSKVSKTIISANLKSGAVGIKISIMTPDIILPDKITIKPKITVEEIDEEPKEQLKVKKEKPKEKKETKKVKEKPKEKKETKKVKEKPKEENGNNTKK
jgi:small subunit ribosomal protein S3